MLYEQPLGGEAPEQIVVTERADKVGSRLERWLFGGVTAMDHAVDAAVLAVAIGIDVGVSLTVFRIIPGAAFVRGRVVLNNKIVPVGHPEIAVGSYFGDDWAEPFIGAGHEAKGVDGLVAGILGADVVHAEEIAGGPTNERASIAPGFGESGAGGKSMAAAGGVGVEGIDLPDVWRDGVKTRRVGDHLGTLAALAAVHGGGQTAEESGIIIGRGAEHIARFIEAHTPCVIVELM